MTSPLWLSHHHEDQSDRCVRIGRSHVCRRCAVLYPGMFVVAALQLAGWISADLGVVLMWVMPLGVVGEWIAEHLARVPYSASRQVVTTALASVSFGVALGRHVRHPFEAAATAPAVTYTVLCLVVWYVGTRRSVPDPTEWETAFEAAEEDRLETLLALLEENGLGSPAQPASQTKSMSSSTAPTRDGLRSL